MEEFGYEKLDVYKCSIDFLSQVYCIIDRLPKGYSHLADQLRRSSLSIPLNIAEGSGKASPAERMRFYEIARSSALECSAILSCSFTLKLINQELFFSSRSLVFRIVQMLSKLAPKNR